MKQDVDINNLANLLTLRAQANQDLLGSTQRMDLTTDDRGISRISLLGEGSSDDTKNLRCNDLFHEQLSSHLKIPRRYYEYIRKDYPNVLDYTVNSFLHQRQPETRMLRTSEWDDERWARAFLSDRYLRRDNYDLAQAVLPILHEIPDVVIRSCALTERRMYLKATTPKVTGQVKVGEEVCAGVYVSNSEVGCGALEIFPFIETLACQNGMIVRREGAGMMRRVHLGRRIEANEAAYAIFSDETLKKDDEVFFEMCGAVVKAAVNEVNFRDLIRQMAEAAQDQPVEDPVAAITVLAKREGLNEDESKDVLKFLATGGDLSRWGVLSAVTRAAEERDEYDRASEMEMLGGKILDYKPSDWKPIAMAAS